MAIPVEVELAIELLILGVLLWLVYTRPREEEVVDAVDEPDLVARFKEIGAGALLEVIEERRATIDRAVVEDLPLEDIKKQNKELIENFVALDKLTKEFKQDNERTRITTKGLSMALSVGIGERGNWGESTFESILSMSGLVEGVNYLHDKPLTNSSNSKSRPDFTIMMADNSAIAVDSKALLGPLINLYDKAMEIPSEKERNTAFKAIADNIWGAIMDKPDGITHREYPKRLEEHFGKQGPSFTVVFIPGDHILAMAYKNDKGRNTHSRKQVPLQEAAYLNGVLLATPTMVMALLTMIRGEWTARKMDEGTQEIRDLTVELYERHVSFGSRLAGIGKGLKAATESYDKAIKSYQGPKGIRKTGEKMVSAGIKEKAGNKELPEPSDSTSWQNPPDVKELDSIPAEEE